MTFEQFLTLLYEIIAGIFKFIWWILTGIYKLITNYEEPLKLNEEYNAGLAEEKEILHPKNLGFNLTGTKKLSYSQSFTHVMLSAQTGLGKTSTVLLPSLYSMADGNSSFITNDSQHENFLKASGYLDSKGIEIKPVNFADETVSEGWNMLSHANTLSEIKKISSLLHRATMAKEGGNGDFWITQSENLTTLVISYIKTLPVPQQNMSNVKKFIDTMLSSHETADRLIAGCNDPSGKIKTEYKVFLNYEPKVLTNILSTARSALGIFDDPSVAAVTSFDTLNFSELRTKRQAIFLMNRAMDMEYYKPLISIFVEQLFAYILSRIPGDEENNIFFLMDELGSIPLPGLPTFLAQARKTRTGFLGVLQDEHQLRTHYQESDYQAIKTNFATKMYMANQPLSVCKEISELMGKRELVKETDDGRTEKTIRSLMTTDEVRFMPADTALIFSGTSRAVYTRLTPFYKQKDMLRYSQMPPVKLSSKLPFNEMQEATL